MDNFVTSVYLFLNKAGISYLICQLYIFLSEFWQKPCTEDFNLCPSQNWGSTLNLTTLTCNFLFDWNKICKNGYSVLYIDVSSLHTFVSGCLTESADAKMGF